MKYARKLSLVLVLAFMIALASGCGLVKVNTEKDRAQVVAEVNGEKVLKGELLDRLDAEKSYYYLTDEMMEDPEYKDYVLSVKKQILNDIVTEKLLFQKAEEAGFVLNDEMREEARKEFDDLVNQIAESMKAEDEAANEDTKGKDYEKEALDYIQEQLNAMQKTQEEYIELIAQYKPIEKFSEKILEDIEVTDEEIQTYYDKELQAQKEDPSYSETAYVKLHEPEMLKIQYIVIELPDEKQEEYADLSAEEGKKEEAQEFLKKELEAIKPKAEEALNKAKEDMDAAIAEYNPDDTAEYMKEGISIYKGNPYFPEEFTEAAFKLSVGEVSSLVETEYGYFIIKAVEKFDEKTYTLKEKQEELKTVVEDKKKSEKWNSLLQEWIEKGVKKYENRL